MYPVLIEIDSLPFVSRHMLSNLKKNNLCAQTYKLATLLLIIITVTT